MPLTLLALYRRPEGGEEALETFLQRYQAEHVPLIAAVPGLRSQIAERVTGTYTQSDFVLACHMVFDDRAALDAGMASDQMRAAGRNLREIAPGLLTLIVLEEGSSPPSAEPVSDEHAA